MLEYYDSNIAPLLVLLRPYTSYVFAGLLTLLGFCRIFHLIATFRTTDAEIGRDVALRITWFVMLVALSWGPVALQEWPQHWDYHWLFARLRYTGFGIWGFHSILTMLMVNGLFAHCPQAAPRFSRTRTAFVTALVLFIIGIITLDVQVLPGLITVALLTIEMSEPHVFKYFSMEPQGDNIHRAANAMMAVLSAGLLVLLLHFSCGILAFRKSRRRIASGVAVVLLAVSTALVFYADFWMVEQISPSLHEFVVSRDIRRLLILFLLSAPITTAIGWKLAALHATSIQIPFRETPLQKTMQLCEFCVVLSLAVACYLHLFVTLGPLSLYYLDGRVCIPGTAIFAYVAPVFACTFASGRWIRMHWSRHLVPPDTYLVRFPLSQWAAYSVIATVQLITFSMSFGWILFILSYIPT